MQNGTRFLAWSACQKTLNNSVMMMTLLHFATGSLVYNAFLLFLRTFVLYVQYPILFIFLKEVVDQK